MPVDQLDTHFVDLSPLEYIVILGTFADLLIAHPFFRDNWPSYLTHPLQLKDDLKAYGEAADAVMADGGRKNLQLRDDLRTSTHSSVVFMAQYVVMRSVSEKDPSFLTSVGLKPKKRAKKTTTKSQTASLGVPPNLDVKRDPDVSGGVLLTWGKVVGAGTYEIDTCTGDPTLEESWYFGGQFKTCRNIRLSGLEPAKQTYFRVRCHGAGMPGPFCQYVGLFVL